MALKTAKLLQPIAIINDHHKKFRFCIYFEFSKVRLNAKAFTQNMKKKQSRLKLYEEILKGCRKF